MFSAAGCAGRWNVGVGRAGFGAGREDGEEEGAEGKCLDGRAMGRMGVNAGEGAGLMVIGVGAGEGIDCCGGGGE